MGFLKSHRSSRASKLDAHPLSFFDELSYIYSSSASVAWQSLLLALTSIDGHLHSRLISRVNVRLSPFLSSHTTSIIISYSTHSAMSMARAHVLRESLKGLRTSKVWNNCLACHRGCAWFEYFVWWRWNIARPYDFVGITFFGHVILKRHDCFISTLEVLLFFMSNDRLFLWITRVLIFMPWLDIWSRLC